MPREKAGYRDTIALLNERYPDYDLLNKQEVARFLGVSDRTLRRYEIKGIIRFHPVTGRVCKADLARMVCV